MQKRAKKHSYVDNKKKNVSWLFYFILGILLVVGSFFIYNGITGRVVLNERASLRIYGPIFLNNTDIYSSQKYILPITSQVYLTGIRMSIRDFDNNCKIKVMRYLNSSEDWVDVTEFKDVPNAMSELSFWEINKVGMGFRIKVDQGCEGVRINNITAWYNYTDKTCFNYTYGSPSVCNATGQRVLVNISKAVGSCPSAPAQLIENCNCTNLDWDNTTTDCLNGKMNITWTKVGNCTGGTPSPANETNVACGSYNCTAPLFCFGSQPANSVNITNRVCENGYCYNCSSGYVWNSSACVVGCSGVCLDVTGLANGTNVSGYCATGKCFQCDSDFIWNNSKCELRQCISLPGCLNMTTLSNAGIFNRNCSVGQKCFACNSGYVWNSNLSACVVNTGGWRNLSFSNSEFLTGKIVTFSVGDRVYFVVNNATYWLGLNSVDFDDYSANVTIYTIGNRTIRMSDSDTKIDFNNDKVYDLLLSLEDVDIGVAGIFIKKISENYGTVVSGGGDMDSDTSIQYDDDSNDDNSGFQSSVGSSENESLGTLGWVIIILFVLIIIVAIVIFVISRKKSSPQKISDKKTVFSPAGVSKQSTSINGAELVQPKIIHPMIASQKPIQSVQPIQQPKVPIDSNVDKEAVSSIREQLKIGEKYVSEGKRLPSRAVYSKIYELYGKMKVPNPQLYSDIIAYYKKVIKLG